MPDPSTPFGEMVAQHLRDDVIVWLTTVGADGTPQPNPVWFLWDGETVLVYSRTDAKRNDHVRARPKVALNFDSVEDGESVVVITGEATIEEGAPLAHEVPAYMTKYGARAAEIFPNQPVDAFARAYPVVIRITPKRVRGF